MLQRMLLAGMNVARLNFSHGDFEQHLRVIENLREASRVTGKRVAIMADLPGPKMRVGELVEEPITLSRDDFFTLTTEPIVGDRRRVSVSFEQLADVVKPGDHLFLNDGIIELEAVRVAAGDVECRVLVGGELRSRKGLNLPGIDLGMSAFTEQDRACLEFALKNGVDAISQSFVEDAADIEAVRKAATEMGFQPFILAKIERAGALKYVDEILHAADGIMIARGDLGVETPIAGIALLQKKLIRLANQLSKPVITATQMLESMVEHNRPTRAEATDVANAILDGTDCVMLSAESAMGAFPVETVEMLAEIAAATEPSRVDFQSAGAEADYDRSLDTHLVDIISRNVRRTVERITPEAVIVPTLSGRTARMVARFKLPVWIAAVSPTAATCAQLQFSYGVSPIHIADHPDDWSAFARQWVASENLPEGYVILTEGPSTDHPHANPRLEIIRTTEEPTPKISQSKPSDPAESSSTEPRR
jgi:pyruvate kinase